RSRIHSEEIDKIVNNQDAPNFENTIVALDNSGQLLQRVALIFNSLNSAHTNDSIQGLARELAPKLSAHRDEITLNPQLFERVKTVWENREQENLTEEQARLLELTYKDYVRNGANLSDEDKEKLKKINAEISVLTLQFGQNLLAETNAFELVIEDEADLSGL